MQKVGSLRTGTGAPEVTILQCNTILIRHLCPLSNLNSGALSGSQLDQTSNIWKSLDIKNRSEAKLQHSGFYYFPPKNISVCIAFGADQLEGMVYFIFGQTANPSAA